MAETQRAYIDNLFSYMECYAQQMQEAKENKEQSELYKRRSESCVNCAENQRTLFFEEIQRLKEQGVENETLENIMNAFSEKGLNQCIQ